MRTQKFDFKSLLDFLTHLFTVLFGGAKKAAKFTGSAAVHVAEDVGTVAAGVAKVGVWTVASPLLIAENLLKAAPTPEPAPDPTAQMVDVLVAREVRENEKLKDEAAKRAADDAEDEQENDEEPCSGLAM